VVPAYRNIVIQCLVEIAGLNVGNIYNEQFKYLYSGTIQQLATFLPLSMSMQLRQPTHKERSYVGVDNKLSWSLPPPTAGIREIHARGVNSEQEFIQQLALFLTSFFREHVAVCEHSTWPAIGYYIAANSPMRIRLVELCGWQLQLIEGPDMAAVFTAGYQYLLLVSDVDDREIFKICLEYWNKLVRVRCGGRAVLAGWAYLSVCRSFWATYVRRRSRTSTAARTSPACC